MKNFEKCHIFLKKIDDFASSLADSHKCKILEVGVGILNIQNEFTDFLKKSLTCQKSYNLFCILSLICFEKVDSFYYPTSFFNP